MHLLRKLTIVAVLSLGASSLSGCAAGFAFANRGVIGAPTIYASTSAGEYVSEQRLGTKSGEGCATSILGLIATGDVSISEAARKGGITRVTHIDHKFENILGLYAKYCVYVYGD
jgi:hypothetical protein